MHHQSYNGLLTTNTLVFGASAYFSLENFDLCTLINICIIRVSLQPVLNASLHLMIL